MYMATKTQQYHQLDRQLKAESKPTTCPWCGSHRIAIMLSGMPVYIPDLEDELDRSRINTRGLPHSEGEPAWQCTECGAQFFKQPQHMDSDN